MKQTFESDANKPEPGPVPPEHAPELPPKAASMMWANPNKPIPTPKRPDHSAQLAPLYSKISELREELDIVESALRHKDPLSRAQDFDTPARMRPAKTELTYEESTDIYQTRKELLKELEGLEAKRDQLEGEQYASDELAEMREAREMIEADKAPDPALGGYKDIEEPNAPKHYSTRVLEKFGYYSGQWHMFQGIKWISEKSGLTRIFKNFGASLKAFDKRMQARLSQGDARKALPPGPSEKKPDDKR